MATFELSPDLDPKVADAIRAAMDALRAEMAAHLGTKPEAAGKPAGDDRLVTLERAVGAIDRAASQTELLGTLLRQAGGFAGRSLFLVLRDDALRGWAAFGFEASAGDVTGVEVEVAAGSPWRYAVDRNVASELDAESCAAVCSQLDAPPAGEGLIVPFALRGRVAGALYADRVGGGQAIDRPALRILTYVASQALETLPLRRAQESPVEVPARPDEDERFEAETSTSRETIPDMDVEELMIQEVERDAEASADEGIVSIRREVKPPEFEIEDDHEVEAQEADAPAEAADAFPSTATETAADRDEEDTTFATRDVSSLRTTRVVEEPAVDEPEPTVDAAEPEDEALQHETLSVTPERQLDDAEVLPPGDLEGPGWAFGAPAEVSEDSRHEEARRLARLLVTEIKLYNEEKVREGREQGNLREQLRDDIDRSRRIYEERIDDEVREATDYFHEECIRILAAGDSTALGA